MRDMLASLFTSRTNQSVACLEGYYYSFLLTSHARGVGVTFLAFCCFPTAVVHYYFPCQARKKLYKVREKCCGDMDWPVKSRNYELFRHEINKIYTNALIITKWVSN